MGLTLAYIHLFGVECVEVREELRVRPHLSGYALHHDGPQVRRLSSQEPMPQVCVVPDATRGAVL